MPPVHLTVHNGQVSSEPALIGIKWNELIRLKLRISNQCYFYIERAGVERVFPKLLRLEVIALLCLKAAVLIFIYFAFFAPVEKPEPNGQTVLIPAHQPAAIIV